MPSEALTRCLIAAGVDTPPPKKAKKKEDLPAEGLEVWDRLGSKRTWIAGSTVDPGPARGPARPGPARANSLPRHSRQEAS